MRGLGFRAKGLRFRVQQLRIEHAQIELAVSEVELRKPTHPKNPITVRKYKLISFTKPQGLNPKPNLKSNPRTLYEL